MGLVEKTAHSDSRPTRVMSIFFHDYAYGKALGGVERRFIEISKRMPGLGVEFFALEYKPTLGRYLQSRYKSIAIDRKKPQSSFQLTKELIRLSVLSAVWTKRTRCQVVYSPSSVYYQVIPALFASICLAKPLVIVFHSLPYKNLRSSFSSLLRASLAKGESLRAALVKSSIEKLRRVAYTHAIVCIAVSNSTGNQIVHTFRPRNLVVSGNGVSEEWLNSAQLPQKFDACFLGRVSPRKGIEVLLHAWNLVVSRYPKAKLVIVGGGEDHKYVQRCKELIQKLSIQDNVVMTGFLDDSSVRNTLHSSRIFVLPSAREGFGLAIVEAMACGLPCVLASLPALKENFGDSAVFVDRQEPQDWANAICNVFEDERAQERLSIAGKRIASLFRWENVAQKEAIAILQHV